MMKPVQGLLLLGKYPDSKIEVLQIDDLGRFRWHFFADSPHRVGSWHEGYTFRDDLQCLLPEEWI